MWLFHFFVEKSIGATLDAHTCMSSSSRARQERKMTSYSEIVNLLFKTYATDDVISKADMYIMYLKLPLG